MSQCSIHTEVGRNHNFNRSFQNAFYVSNTCYAFEYSRTILISVVDFTHLVVMMVIDEDGGR